MLCLCQKSMPRACRAEEDIHTLINIDNNNIFEDILTAELCSRDSPALHYIHAFLLQLQCTHPLKRKKIIHTRTQKCMTLSP